MLRSLFAGVSGLRSHQTFLDVTGNNIANVNTTGFKASTTAFQDLLSQVLQGATSGTTVQGGSNPAQVGLGVRVAAITTNFSQGALQNTGKSTDIALQGDGFFIVRQNGQEMYTRAGNFDFDTNGNFVNVNGGLVQGWMVNPATGVADTTATPGLITLPPGQITAPIKTNNIVLGNMLSSDAPVGALAHTTSVVYDTQGNANELNFNLEKTAANTWDIETIDQDGTSLGSATIVFDPATGRIASQTPATYQVSPNPAPNWPTPLTVSFGAPGDPKALKEFAGISTIDEMSQDGLPSGTLQSFRIAADGTITGVFSNGTTKAVAQIAIANFNNPSGLEKASGNNYRMTPNSGTAQIGAAGTAGRGTIAGGTLEMSNVDLGAEFTNLIIGQRGFQANSKVITTSDEMLQELLNMKR